MAREQGMDTMVKTVMKQIRDAVEIEDLQDPDWARLKLWPGGSLISWNGGATGDDLDDFVDKISRPLGAAMPVFYGNSEVCRNGSLHGWAEGALVMVRTGHGWEGGRALGLEP